MDYIVLGVIFSLVMGVSLYLNRQSRYISQPFLFSSYFFLASVLIAYVFPQVLELLFHPYSLGIILGTYVLALFGYALARRVLDKPSALIARHGVKNAFIRLEYPFLFTKGFEIAFQQLCFATLILLLSANDFSLPLITALGATALVVAHLPLFSTHGMQWGSFYAASSLVLGLLFPYLILSVPAGLAIAFAIHLLAYVVMGALIWGFQAKIG